MSIPALANTTPVRPPIKNINKNPLTKCQVVIGVEGDTRIAPPQIEANQLNTFTPVGTAITIVAAVK